MAVDIARSVVFEYSCFPNAHVNRLAAAGKITWRGVRCGAKVYRRYDPREVLDELKHAVKASGSAPRK
jgi:hypothetical protein